MSEIRLKSCPFCGSEAQLIPQSRQGITVGYRAECSKCTASLPYFVQDMETAIDAWNTRRGVVNKFLNRGKHPNGEWIYGYYRNYDNDDNYCVLYAKDIIYGKDIIPETAGRFAGIYDKKGKCIFEDDIVILFGHYGKVIQQCGAFGIYLPNGIDYDYLASEIAPITGSNAAPMFCRDNNFVSFWELMRNYKQTDVVCGMVEVVGNAYDNPDLIGD